MERKSAQLLLLIATSMGCILPPDGKSAGTSLGPYPPHVDLAQVFPRKAKLRFHPSCDNQALDVMGISDPDSDLLLFRWVANNGLENTVLIQDESQVTGRPVNERIDHRDTFGPLADGGTGVISLFITDAPVWEDPNPEPAGGESADLSKIPAGSEDASVVEIRWTFEYDPSLGSNVCGE